MDTKRFKCFTAKKITLTDEGKKRIEGLPSGWEKLTESKIVKGHKALCVRTGRLNNITVIDFDSEKSYNKAIKKFPDLSQFFTIKTPRGFHIYAKYNPEIKTTTNVERKIDVRNDGAFVFGAGTVREDSQEYRDLIQGDLNLELSDDIIKYVGKKPKKKNATPTPIIKDEKKQLSKIKEICGAISTHLIQNYDSWLKIIWAMRNSPEIDEDFARSISMKASNYTTEGFNKVYFDTKHGRTITPPTLFYYAKKSGSKKFYEIIRKHDKYSSQNECTVIDMADKFIELVGDNIVCTKKEELLVWSGDYWRLDRIGDIMTNMIEKVLLEYYKGFLDTLDEGSEARDNIINTIHTLSTQNGMTNVYKTVRRKAKIVEHDITFNMLESQNDNLHFRNGVLNVVTEEFRPRDKYDYMTLSLSWDYETDKSKIPTTITDDINSMLFKMDSDDDINKFIKAWLFYCLTGSTELQKFLIQLGEDASNGKSTLFSIMSKCFEFYTYKLDSKVFDVGYAHAHKQLINLITKPVRFVYIEELGSKQIDAQLIKDTTDGEINVNVMYENSSVVKTQAKINIGSNGIPNIKMDNGVRRRMKIKECKSQFVDGITEDDYKNRKFVKDEKLIKKFLCDDYKNAFLNILLEHKTVVIPDALNKYTDEIQSDCDPFKSALEDHFILTDDEADRTNVLEIETTLSSGSYNSKTIKSHMRRLGFKVDSDKRYKDKKGCYLKIRLKHDGE